MVVVRGGSGAGKTALLLTLAGRMTPSAGRLEGQRTPPPRRRGGGPSRGVSLTEIAGVNDLDPLLTVADHVDERLATTTWHPWVSGRDRTEALRRLDALAAAAAAAVPDAHLTATLGPRLRVRELTAIQRWCSPSAWPWSGTRRSSWPITSTPCRAQPTGWRRGRSSRHIRDRVVTVIASCHDLPHDVRGTGR